MKKKEEFIYFQSRKSGLVLTLGNGLSAVVLAPVAPDPGSGEPYYGLLKISKTESAKIEAIMKHKAFGKTVFRMLTKKEIDEKIRLEKAAEYVANLKEEIAIGVIPYPDLDSLKVNEIYSFANRVGVSVYTVDDGEETKKIKAQLVAEIEEKLKPASEPEEKDKS